MRLVLILLAIIVAPPAFSVPARAQIDTPGCAPSRACPAAVRATAAPLRTASIPTPDGRRSTRMALGPTEYDRC
jgi:hypothetical protein